MIGKFLRRQSVSIFRATAHALHSTGFLGRLLEGSSGSFRSKTFRSKTKCKSLYTYLTVCFAFEKPRWLLHNTADRAETVFSHLKRGISTNSPIHNFLSERIEFNQNALRHFLPECLASQTAP